jgi:enterochelin esterase-like enzyme
MVNLKGILTGFIVVLSSSFGHAQNYSAFQTPLHELYSYSFLKDTAQSRTQSEAWWKLRQEAHQIPLIVEDSVAFFYKGPARTVEWMADFNGWGSSKNFDNKAKLVPGTNIWILKAAFPRDARLDYKILVNGSTWLIDPENPLQQWSGVGGGSPNSELCMPDWKEDPVLKPRENIPHGRVIQDILLDSKILGYQITYNVYLPAGSEDLGKLPCLYVTDGYEYMHPRLGNMITILDNLIADKKIKPVIVIFVDHREPVNRGNNKRMDELAMNPKYLDFFTAELIPAIEKDYPVIPSPSSRAIMGSSMGGLNAAYFAFSRPGIFGLAGIQSPAFWMRPQIYIICNNPEHPTKVSMTSGVISDASEASRKMKEILQTNACSYQYHEVNDGHSWGNWRNTIDDVLVDLFGT